MSYPSSLLSFYIDRRAAAEARKQLRSKRIQRSALIHKAKDGPRPDRKYQTAARRALGGQVIGFVVGSTVGLATLGLGEIFTGLIGPLVLVLATLAGVGTGWVVVNFLGLGVTDRLIKKHSPRLVAGESVIVVQASPALMGPGDHGAAARGARHNPQFSPFTPGMWSYSRGASRAVNPFPFPHSPSKRAILWLPGIQQ